MAITRSTNKSKSYPDEKTRRRPKTSKQRLRTKGHSANTDDITADHEVRMLFDLKASCDGEYPPPEHTDLSRAASFSDPLEDLLDDVFSDAPIVAAGANIEDGTALQVFHASLNPFNPDGSSGSSPDSIFSDFSQDAQSSDGGLEFSDPNQGPDMSTCVSETYDDHSRDVINILKLLSADVREPAAGDTQTMLSGANTGQIVINAITQAGPNTQNTPITQNLSYSQTALHDFNTSLRYEAAPGQAHLHFPPSPVLLNTASHVPMSFPMTPAMPSPGMFLESGNVVKQFASPQCSCVACATSTIKIGLLMRRASKPSVLKDPDMFKVFGTTPDDFKEPKNQVQPKKLGTIFPDEPGVVSVIKPGSRRPRALNKETGRVRRKSTYAFKPPSEYMIKAWNSNCFSEKKSTAGPLETESNGGINNSAREKPVSTGQFSPLPREVELSALSATERWNRYKHRYAQIDHTQVPASRECCHCNRLFESIESYAVHLERHKIQHEFFCLDERCPLAVIGYRTRWELRRHTRNDHLDQYSPYMTTHMHELVKDDLTRRMLDSIYICKYECCRKPFYRLDSMGRHLKLAHPKIVKKKVVREPINRLKLPVHQVTPR